MAGDTIITIVGTLGDTLAAKFTEAASRARVAEAIAAHRPEIVHFDNTFPPLSPAATVNDPSLRAWDASTGDAPGNCQRLLHVFGVDQHIAEEFAVVDRVGRMQLPKEYLERLSIRDRVRLEHCELYASGEP